MKCVEARELILDSFGIFKLREKSALYSDLLESRGIRDMIRIARESFGEDFLNIEKIEGWTPEEKRILEEILKINVEPTSYTGKVFLLLSDFLEYLISLILPHIEECKSCLDFLLFICPEVLYEGLNFEINEGKTREILEKIGIKNYEEQRISFTEMIWGEEAEEISCDDFNKEIDGILKCIIKREEKDSQRRKKFFHHFNSCNICEETLIERASSLNQLYKDR